MDGTYILMREKKGKNLFPPPPKSIDQFRYYSIKIQPKPIDLSTRL